MGVEQQKRKAKIELLAKIAETFELFAISDLLKRMALGQAMIQVIVGENGEVSRVNGLPNIAGHAHVTPGRDLDVIRFDLRPDQDFYRLCQHLVIDLGFPFYELPERFQQAVAMVSKLQEPGEDLRKVAVEDLKDFLYRKADWLTMDRGENPDQPPL